MGKGNGVLVLASALVKQKDSDKAIARIKKDVKGNENAWRNELFAAGTRAEEAADALEALQCSTSTTAAQMLAATRAAELAAKDFDAMSNLAEERFEKKLD